MVTVSICFGSACHLRGAYSVLNAFKALLDKYKVEGNVELEGNFCKGRCTEGVIIKIGDEVITHVAKEKVHDIFVEKILGELS